MRHYPTDKYDFEELERLNAEQWQIDCLKINPDYTCWGNFEDYMCKEDGGWDKRCNVDTVDEGLWGLDDYNECVHFYFNLERESENCIYCDQTGYNPATKQISDDWYDFNRTGRRWDNKITDHEVNALWEAGRLKGDFKEKPTAEKVNVWADGKRIGHDGINKNICVRARAEREGVYGLCEHCEGHGYIYTEPKANLGLQLWILHPRKGCSRGVYIKNIEQSELPKVYRWLHEAAERNAKRFENIPIIE